MAIEHHITLEERTDTLAYAGQSHECHCRCLHEIVVYAQSLAAHLFTAPDFV